MKINLPEQVYAIMGYFHGRGAHAYLVGGCVRDAILGRPIKDYDIEIFGATPQEVEETLSNFGVVDMVGKAFGVYKLHHLENVDFSLPRMDSKTGPGHKDFRVLIDGRMDRKAAARRRDLTMNSIFYDPIEEMFHDPYDGVFDIARGVMRVTDPETFLEDQLRPLRVCQFASRLGFRPDWELLDLMKKADLSALSNDRFFAEFKKMLLGEEPGKGLKLLCDTGLDRFFPEIRELRGCQQDKTHHPEGDVLDHTILVLNEARKITSDLTVLLACLCHDFGKPAVTEKGEDGRWHSYGHEEAGAAPTESFLRRIVSSEELIRGTKALVTNHMHPVMFGKNGAKPSAFRRLARRLAQSGVTMEQLILVAKADSAGRDIANLKRDTHIEWFENKVKSVELDLLTKPCADVVMGRHLIERGLNPGPEFGKILERCREIQYETGETDPQKILDMVFGKSPIPIVNIHDPQEDQ